MDILQIQIQKYKTQLEYCSKNYIHKFFHLKWGVPLYSTVIYSLYFSCVFFQDPYVQYQT